MTFSKKLKQLRTEQGLTQEQLADGVHVSRTLINKYENEAVEPTLDNIKRIAEFFSVAEDYFNDDEVSKTKFFSKITWVDVLLLSFPVLYIIFYFIPLYGGYYYIYPIPSGQSTPDREFIVKSSFQIFQDKTIWFGWIGILISFILIAFVILGATYKKNKLWKYTLSVVLFLFTIISFLTVAFSIGFTN